MESYFPSMVKTCLKVCSAQCGNTEINLTELQHTFQRQQYKSHYVLAGVGHVLVCCDDGLEAQVNNLYFTDGVHCTHHQLREQGGKQTMRGSQFTKTKAAR